jgi:hypothetical protein
MRGWSARWISAGGAAVVATLVWASAALAAPVPCATVMPLADVTTGMTGTGWTVVQGTDPDSFDVEVLGIGRGLIAPGRDVIIVRISGPTVDVGGGVWAGMSGSPVYIGGDFVGALAYGFSFGATNIAGLTPAEDMLRVDGLPVSPRVPARVRLPASLVRSVAAQIGAAVPTVGGSLVRLKMPVSVSGVSPRRFMRVKKLLRRHKVSFNLTSGSAALSSLAGTVDTLVPGGNFSAALSYGDVTIAGVGTTSYVCDGQALAFGHPMLFTGRSSLGAGGGEALAIIPDPLGPYKLANVSGAVGKLDQDRLAGIRAVDGDPATIPVTTAVTSLDTLASRVGETDVVLKSEFPDLAFTHIFSNIDSVFDQIGAGSSDFSWTIQGTRADGTPWELHRTNMYVSDFDLSFDSSFEIADELALIAAYPLEHVKFTGVEASINVEDTVRSYELLTVLVCRRGICQSEDPVFARPGKTLSLRAVLRPSDGSADEVVPFQLTIPPGSRAGGLIDVGGSNGCLGSPGGEGGCEFIFPDTFPKLLRLFRRQQMNNVLTARLRTGEHAMVRDREDFPFDQVVTGSIQIQVFFPGQCCPPDLAGEGPPPGGP